MQYLRDHDEPSASDLENSTVEEDMASKFWGKSKADVLARQPCSTKKIAVTKVRP